MNRRKLRKPQRSAADRTLPLPTFEPRISRERAFELVKRIPIGTRLESRLRRCGKPECLCVDGPGHGPYWAAKLGRSGSGRSIYIGRDEAKAILEVAWRMVGAELAAARAKVEATPEWRAYAKLLALIAPAPREPRKVIETAPAAAAKEDAA